MANYLSAIVAENLNVPPVEVATASCAIAHLYPASPGGRAALLILTALAMPSPERSVEAAESVAAAIDKDGRKVVAFLGSLLAALARFDRNDPLLQLAYRSSVGVFKHGGEVVFRFECIDGPEELAFTIDAGRFAPERDTAVTSAKFISGRNLLYIARDLSGASDAA